MATLLGEQARWWEGVYTAFIGAILADFSVILSTDSRLLREEKFPYAVRGEHRLAKDTHDLELWPANLEVVPDDGNETAYDDCYMNLYADGILGLSQNSLTRRCHIRPCNYTVLWSV